MYHIWLLTRMNKLLSMRKVSNLILYCSENSRQDWIAFVDS